jgi:Cu2+-containing amine oxidase
MTEGERAEALRVLLEDSRLSSMASIGRYRVIALEPLAVKPPHGLAGRRLARVVVYDYASDRTVDACVDLDHVRVAHLNLSRAQPMLAREEEAAAISIALSDERVKEQLSLGEEPQVAMHYWSNNNASLSFARRSAAVIFGRPDSSPSLIAVVDLLDNLVSEIVPATQW